MNWIPATTPELDNDDTASWAFGRWRKLADPIMSPRPSGFDSRNIYNVAAVSQGDEIHMIVRGEDAAEAPGHVTGRLGLATSRDGFHFEREANPVLVPEQDYEVRGVEDPRLIQVDGTFYLTYSAYDGHKARLCMATSTDMRSWQRHGVLFPEFAPFSDWTKSGAILPERLSQGRFKGKYIMYFGDTDMWLAHSEDLLNWTYEPEPVIRPRLGKFDARLVEPGPPPLRTREGILQIYNSADLATRYSAGYALFDLNDPTKLLRRSETPFIEPTRDWEIEGYVPLVVFVEGLVKRDGQWLLYFGGADRHVGVAATEFRPEMLPTDSPWLS